MALTSDLMGLGMPPALAQLEGVSLPAPLAGVGTAQVGAAPLVSGAFHQATTTAGQTAFRLPADQPLGTFIAFYNASATAALVFPPTGGNVNELATNASFSIAQGRLAQFFRLSALKWVVQYGA